MNSSQDLEATLASLAEHPPLTREQLQRWRAAALEPAVVVPLPSKTNASAWLVALLATVALWALVAVALRSAIAPSRNQPAHELASAPILVVPLNIAICFGQIEQDLQSAEQQVAEVSEAVQLAELQRELQATLEHARQWEEH